MSAGRYAGYAGPPGRWWLDEFFESFCRASKQQAWAGPPEWKKKNSFAPFSLFFPLSPYSFNHITMRPLHGIGTWGKTITSR